MKSVQFNSRSIIKRLKREKFVPQRFYSSGNNYNYHQQYQYKPPRGSWAKRLLYTTIGFTALTASAYYLWWPKHTFPSSVAKILRKGLWAESDKGEKDYQLALKYYLEAIEHANEIDLDKLSDEYTGIQLKAAEMFERLNMLEDAAFIYNEIATLYLAVLTADPQSPEGKRIQNRDHRLHLIQKDLRIAIKLVELNSNNPHLSKAILLTHLIIAQSEVQKKLGANSSIGKIIEPSAASDVETPQYKATINSDVVEIENNGVVTIINKNPAAWEPFTDEFFNILDLLSAICISTGDLGMASRVKISMTEWMLLADVEPHKILLSQCNLASLLYLQAEEFESQEIAMRRKFSEKLAIDYNKIKNKEVLEENKELVEKFKKELNDAEKEKYNLAIRNKEQCVQLAIKSYESVLEFAKNLPQDIVNSNNTVNETVALATYGLGVVNLHLSNYDKAERLLRESRVRSKNCNYDDLLNEIERELSKLFKEKKLIKIGKQFNKDDADKVDIEMDIHMKK